MHGSYEIGYASRTETYFAVGQRHYNTCINEYFGGYPTLFKTHPHQDYHDGHSQIKKEWPSRIAFFVFVISATIATIQLPATGGGFHPIWIKNMQKSTTRFYVQQLGLKCSNHRTPSTSLFDFQKEYPS